MALSAPINQPIGVEEDATQYSKNTVWRRFRKHKLAMAGAIVLLLMVLVAVFAHQFAPYDPNGIDEVHWQGNPLPPCFQDALHCGGHSLGTDENGRDLLSRLMFGARISLTVGVAAVIMELFIGTLLGAVAGYYGGWIDYIIMRLTDVFLSIPLLPLLLTLTGIVAASSSKASLGFGVIVVIIGGLSWPGVARLVRASYLSLREREYTEAARALGNGDGRIMLRHLLPNAIAPIIVQWMPRYRISPTWSTRCRRAAPGRSPASAGCSCPWPWPRSQWAATSAWGWKTTFTTPRDAWRPTRSS